MFARDGALRRLRVTVLAQVFVHVNPRRGRRLATIGIGDRYVDLHARVTADNRVAGAAVCSFLEATPVVGIGRRAPVGRGGPGAPDVRPHHGWSADADGQGVPGDKEIPG